MKDKGSAYADEQARGLRQNGRSVDQPSLDTPHSFVRCRRCGDDDPQNIRSDGLCGDCYNDEREDQYMTFTRNVAGIYTHNAGSHRQEEG
jgi:hypothetical protein